MANLNFITERMKPERVVQKEGRETSKINPPDLVNASLKSLKI